MSDIQIISDPEKFKKELLSGVEKKLQEFAKTLNTSDNDELLTVNETASLLKVSKVTLWSWQKSGKLKSVSIGNRIYYRRSAINEALNQNN